MSGDGQVESKLDGSESMERTVRSPRPSLQSLLVEAGVAGEVELRGLAEEARQRGLRLGELLVARGLLDEERLGRLVAEQWRLPFFDRQQLALDPVAAGLLPVEQARELGGCVIGFLESGGPLVVVAEPTSERLNRLRERLSPTTADGQVSFAVVRGSSLEGLLGQLARFHQSDAAPPAQQEPAPVQGEQAAEGAGALTGSERASVSSEASSAAEATQADALIVDLEQATSGLEILRDRVEQLRAAGHAREQLAAELRRERDEAGHEASRLQERVGQLEVALEQERERDRALRQRLLDVLADFER
jgi:hypothetical protein